MLSNDNHFTKEPYEDNGRCKIHPLSEEGKEAYLSKDSYNYNFIRTKKNPDLLKEIQEEMKAESTLKNQPEKKNEEKSNEIKDKKEDLKKEEKCSQNNKGSGPNKGNKSKSKKDKKPLNQKNNMNNKANVKTASKDGNKKNEKDNLKGKQSPGSKLANTIKKMGKVAPPVIRNINNDRGKLKDFSQPFHA
mgnify:CR=1 FL=1